MQTLKGYVEGWTDFIGTSITGLFLTTATAIFFYAVVRFILKRSSGDAKGLDDAKSMLGWSVIALTVMFSIWGIVSFLQSGILGSAGNKTSIIAPTIQSSGSNSGSGTTNRNTGSGTGTKVNGASCTVSGECISGICSAGVCSNSGNGSGRSAGVGIGGSCRITAECNTGLICDSNKVCNKFNDTNFSNEGRGKKTTGSTCTLSSECISGNCNYDPESRSKLCKD
jgi:hypothetical protein